MNQKIIFLSILLFLSSGNSFAQKGLSFGLSADYCRNFMGIDKEKTTNKNMRNPSDWMMKAQVKLNYDLSKRFYLSSGTGIYAEYISEKWRTPFYPYYTGKNFHPKFFRKQLDAYLFLPLTVGYKITTNKKYNWFIETGLMASLTGGSFDNSARGAGEHMGGSYEKGDSTYFLIWISEISIIKPIAINALFKVGLTKTTKHKSVFAIHLLVSRGLIKTMVLNMNYYEGINENYNIPLPNSMRLPDATYNFYSRGSQFGLGISYLINWNELKKNKKLEKQYENLQSK